MRSTQRLLFSLVVPSERLRHSTPKRNALSAWLFVGSDFALHQKDPEGIHLPQQATAQAARVIGPVMILVDQLAEPRIPGSPLSTRGRSRGHAAEPLQLGKRPVPQAASSAC